MKPFAKMASAVRTVANNNFIVKRSQCSQSKSGDGSIFLHSLLRTQSSGYDLPFSAHTHNLSLPFAISINEMGQQTGRR
jgi:hypothetical protein